jgi:hypothetical protein|tara:strand:+ start:13482 stop:13670 length:189 start_codon:yes stop_codon:yes gene_type:complete
LRYIKPFLAGEKSKKIPVNSIYKYNYKNGYTAIYTSLRKEPFLATASTEEIGSEIYGDNYGR